MNNRITKAALILIAAASAAACSDPKAAHKALADAGYTNIETTGYVMFACSENDNFATGFKAIGPTGRNVTGVVCSGWFKGNTIRTW